MPHEVHAPALRLGPVNVLKQQKPLRHNHFFDCFGSSGSTWVSSSGVTSMSVARSFVHCSSDIGLSLIKKNGA
jgi:hypothetical protein